MTMKTGPGFFRHNGENVYHLQKHQDCNAEFWYLLGNDQQFDVRELPKKFLGRSRDAVNSGDLAAHRKVISAAMDAGHFGRPVVNAATGSIADYLDRTCAELLHPLDGKDDSTSFARGEIDQIAYKLPDDEDFSYITANSEDDEIEQLAQHVVTSTTGNGTPPQGQIAEYLKQVRDEMQRAKPPKELPPDPEEMNDERARWADQAIVQFEATTRVDREDALADLLGNLMHWADRNGFDFNVELERAWNHYTEETRPD